jgi:hypothetical protein
MEQEKFRKYFEEKVTPDQNRWHRFLNNLDECNLRELIMHMETFRDEIVFVLNNTGIPKDESFEFLKRLSIAVYSMKGVRLNSDEFKIFARFIWSTFTGWDPISGREEDIVRKMIDNI